MPPTSPTPPSITLFTRVGCHLCQDARDVVAAVGARTGAPWREVDVDADPEDQAEYGDRVPVVLVGNVEHAQFRVDPDRLLAALTA
jgi:glutaredoxin